MENESIRTIFQYLIYGGWIVMVIGAIVVYKYKKIIESEERTTNWEKAKVRTNIFHYLIYGGSILMIIGTIVVDHYTKKIESIEKEKVKKIEIQRDEALRKNIENTELIMRMNSFFAEIDNKLESLYLIIKIKEDFRLKDLDKLECYVKLSALNRKYKFKIKTKVIEDENHILIEEASIIGNDWSKEDYGSAKSTNLKESDEFVFELLPIKMKKEYKDKILRDLHNTYFQFVVTTKHIKIIDKIIINANDWNICIRKCDDNVWKTANEVWLDKHSVKLSTYYTEYETRQYTSNNINFFIEGGYRHYIEKNVYNNLNTSIIFNEESNKNIDPVQGTIILHIDNKWLIKDNNVYKYDFNMKRDEFELECIRDDDNILKIIISTKHWNNIMLKCEDSSPFSISQNQHDIGITYSKDELNFYIDGRLVDRKLR